MEGYGNEWEREKREEEGEGSESVAVIVLHCIIRRISDP